MMRNSILIALIVIVVAVGGFLLYRGLSEKISPEEGAIRKAQELVPVTSGQANGSVQGEKKYHQAVTIDSQSFFFSPDAFRVKRGEKVTVNVRARGDHTFVIDELKINVKTPDGAMTKIEFTPEKEGAFRYYCDKPGHREAGQTGMVIVE